MKDRIRQLMEMSKLSQQDFAARLAISPASLSSIFTGRSNPTTTHVKAVHHAFPEISLNWLIFGEGEMYDTNSSAQPTTDTPLPLPSTGIVIPSHEAAAEQSSASSTIIPQRDNGQTSTKQSHQTELFDLTHTHGISGDSPSLSFGKIDKETKRIKEIRTFYDDGTYEIFVPAH